MRANSCVTVKATLNADDLLELIEAGEVSSDGVELEMPKPEVERFKELLDE